MVGNMNIIHVECLTFIYLLCSLILYQNASLSWLKVKEIYVHVLDGNFPFMIYVK